MQKRVFFTPTTFYFTSSDGQWMGGGDTPCISRALCIIDAAGKTLERILPRRSGVTVLAPLTNTPSQYALGWPSERPE